MKTPTLFFLSTFILLLSCEEEPYTYDCDTRTTSYEDLVRFESLNRYSHGHNFPFNNGLIGEEMKLSTRGSTQRIGGIPTITDADSLSEDGRSCFFLEPGNYTVNVRFDGCAYTFDTFNDGEETGNCPCFANESDINLEIVIHEPDTITIDSIAFTANPSPLDGESATFTLFGKVASPDLQRVGDGLDTWVVDYSIVTVAEFQSLHLKEARDIINWGDDPNPITIEVATDELNNWAPGTYEFPERGIIVYVSR